MEPVLLNSRGFADRLHILLSEKVVSESFQNVDISLLVHFALTKSLPGVKQLCDAGIPDGSVPPGLTGGHMKHIASVIYSLSQECVCCLVFFLKDLADYFDECAAGKRCSLASSTPVALPAKLLPPTLSSKNSAGRLPELESPEPSSTRASPEPSRPRRPPKKRIADVRDIKTPERYKSPRISCPEFPQPANHTEHPAADCPSPPTSISGISSLHNVAIPADPFVAKLSAPDLAANNWMGFKYTVDELFEHGVKQDPSPSIQRYGSHLELAFPAGVMLFIKQDSLAISDGNRIDWSVVKDEIKQGIGGADCITTFLLRPNSIGSSTMLVAKCGKVGVLFQTLTIWQTLRNKDQRTAYHVGMLEEADLKLVGKSVIF